MAQYTLYIKGLPWFGHEGEYIETFKLFGQLAQFYQLNESYQQGEVLQAKRRGLCYVKFVKHADMMKCYHHMKGGVSIPTGNRWGHMFAERSSKELIQPGFPNHHRDGMWSGENARYAKPIARYCSTVFGEFSTKQLKEGRTCGTAGSPTGMQKLHRKSSRRC